MAGLFFLSFADRIIEKLISSELRDIGSRWGIENDLQKLLVRISFLKDLLLDAEGKQFNNVEVKNWLQKVQDVFHDADVLLDAFHTEALRGKIMSLDQIANNFCVFYLSHNVRDFRLMSRSCREMKKISDTIAKISAAKISADRSSLIIDPHLEVTPTPFTVRQTTSFIREGTIIGRDGDKAAVINLLLDSSFEERVSIIPVVGMGGLGKTALAQLVFNDRKIEDHFDLKMWVYVSDVFDLKKIVKNIIESAAGSIPENLEMDQLQSHFEKEIAGKKYLVVLDDVWCEDLDKWFCLESLLMGGAMGSKVLLTTRSDIVAKITHTIQPYYLKGLDSTDSWSLFKRWAFHQGVEPRNRSIVAIGMEMVEKCKGVPLAIRTIASILYSKNSRADWLSIKNDGLGKVSQRENDIIPILKLSYNQLPSHLRHCFAYCSLFPKNFEIDVQMLIKLWMAQGFIKLSDSSQCFEDVGREYFRDLFQRSYFQQVATDVSGDIAKCKMHDLMHDLAIHVARTDWRMGYVDEKFHNLSSDIQLLSKQLLVLLKGVRSAREIRSFLLPRQSGRKYEGRLDKSICDTIILSFKFLRMLDLHDSGIKTLSNYIGQLIHLRYLDLSRNVDLKSLPRSITRLLNLQTLKLSSCFGLQELPRDLKNLVKLRHLEIDDCYSLTHMPRGLGQLTDLQTLSQFSLCKDSDSASGRSGDLDELQALNNLRGELRIKNLRPRNDVKAACLVDKHNLQSLIVDWDTGADSLDCEKQLEFLEPHTNLKALTLNVYEGVKLSTWLLSLSNLVELSLRRCRRCKSLPPLHQCPSLAKLVLDEMVSLEYILKNGKDGLFSLETPFFPSLRELWLSRLPKLHGWFEQVNFEEENSLGNHKFLFFPGLSKLFIEDCPKLTSLPLFPTLKEELVLDTTSLKPFQQTLMMKTATDIASSSTSVVATLSLSPLSNLRSLSFVGIKELDECNADTIIWKALKSLRILRLDYLPKLATLPEGLRNLTSLQELHIWRCSMEAIPGWIINLNSLEKLAICICPNLKSLPDQLGSLSSLNTLEIEDCPTLLQRCQKETGADWDKIARIPKCHLGRLSGR